MHEEDGPAIPNKRWFTTEETAELTGISLAALRNWARRTRRGDRIVPEGQLVCLGVGYRWARTFVVHPQRLLVAPAEIAPPAGANPIIDVQPVADSTIEESTTLPSTTGANVRLAHLRAGWRR